MDRMEFSISIDEFIQIGKMLQESKLDRVQELRISAVPSLNEMAMHYNIELKDKKMSRTHSLYKKIIHERNIDLSDG